MCFLTPLGVCTFHHTKVVSVVRDLGGRLFYFPLFASLLTHLGRVLPFPLKTITDLLRHCFFFFSPLPTRVTLGNNVKNNATYYFYNIHYALLWEVFKKNHQKTTVCPHVNLPYMRCMQEAVRKPQ